MTPPGPVDGVSLVDVIRQPKLGENRQVYAEFALQTPNAKYMMRSGGYKYTYRANDMPELCHLPEDPKEMRNLAWRICRRNYLRGTGRRP